MKSDARTIANEEETYFTDNQRYLGITSATATPSLNGNTVRLSNGNTVSVTVNATNSAFCAVVGRAGGAQPASQDYWVYVSSKGGLQPTGQTSCPVTY
jgi:hypothetical protein